MKGSLVTSWVCVVMIALQAEVTWGQKRCCGPAQWSVVLEQTRGLYVANTAFPVTLATTSANIYMDRTKGLIAVDKFIVNATTGKSYSQTVIDHLMEGARWVIDENDHCEKFALHGETLMQCVPDSASFLGGRDYLTLPVDVWYEQPPGNVTIMVRFFLDHEACFNVAESLALLDHSNMFSLSVIHIVNVTLGVWDPSVFVPPPSCPKLANFRVPGRANQPLTFHGYIEQLRDTVGLKREHDKL